MVRIITVAAGLASLLALVEAEELTPKYAPFPKHIKKRAAPVNSTIVVETTIVQKTITETLGLTSDSGITITKQSAKTPSTTTTSSADAGGIPILSDISSALSSLTSQILSTPAVVPPSPKSTPATSSSSPAAIPNPVPNSGPTPSSSPNPPAAASTSSPPAGGLPLTSDIGNALSSLTSKVVSAATSVVGGDPVPPPATTSTTPGAGPGQQPSSSPPVGGLPLTSAVGSALNSLTSQIGSAISSATANPPPIGPGPATSSTTAPPVSSSTPPGGLPDPGSVLSSFTSQVGSVISSLTGSPPVGTPLPSTNLPPQSSTPPVNSNPIGSIISSATSVINSATSQLPIGSPSSSLPISVPGSVLPSSTSLPASIDLPGSSSSAAAATSNSAAVSPSSAAPAAQTSSAPTVAYPSTGPQSIKPTATDTLTSLYMPSTIVFDSTASAGPSTVTSATGIPSTLPGQLQNPFNGGTIPQQPPGNTLCNFAFTKELDYNFVVSTPYAVKEIFYYTPKAVQYALNGTDSNVPQMHTLRPYDTSASGYITTLAYFWLPNNYVDNLQAQLLAANSWMHKNQSADPQTNTFITLIDSTFPLRAANINSPTGTSSAPTNGPDPGNLNGNSGSGSSTVNTTAVGAGVGAVAGAALYGAIMFYVARRYRKRRAGHSRSSSVIDTSSMAQSHGEMMTGAGSALMAGHEGYYGTNGRISRESGSSRGRDISAPMMAENSLGWN